MSNGCSIFVSPHPFFLVLFSPGTAATRLSVVAVNRPQQQRQLRSWQGVACTTDVFATGPYEQHADEFEKVKYGNEMESEEEIEQSSIGPELVCYLSSTPALDSRALGLPDRSLKGTATETEVMKKKFTSSRL